MKTVLLIRGGKTSRVLDLLAVAAELSQKNNGRIHIDAVVPAGCAPYLRLSKVLKRVIEVNAPDIEGMAAGEPPAQEGEGIGGKLFSKVKKISGVAGKNMQVYWQLTQELRAIQYDEVFDFDFTPFTIAASKIAKAGKIIGFTPDMLENPAPIASLSAHEVFSIPGEMSDSSRLRHLVARYYNYSAAGSTQPFNWELRQCNPPAEQPESLYGVVDDDVPAPFLEILEQHQFLFMLLEKSYTAEEAAGLIRNATVVIGGGIASALAAATRTTNLFIGAAARAPQGATAITTPSALNDRLKRLSSPDSLSANKPSAGEEKAGESSEASVPNESSEASESGESSEPKKIKLTVPSDEEKTPAAAPAPAAEEASKEEIGGNDDEGPKKIKLKISGGNDSPTV